MFYRQCKLKKGNVRQTSWIPERFAEVGRVLALGKRGREDPGWVVEEVGARVSEELLRVKERAHLHQRSVSDV